MIRVRNSIVQNKALRNQRMMRYAMTAITAAVVIVLLYAIIFIFYVDPGAVK